MKKFNTFMVTMFVTLLLLSSITEAKPGGFGGRSSSSSSSSSSSRSISISPSKSVFSSNTSKAIFAGGTVAAGTSYATSKSKPEPVKISRDNVMTALSGGKGAKGDAAGVLYKNFQNSNPSPLAGAKKVTPQQIEQTFTPQYRETRRTQFYGTYNPIQMAPVHYREIVYANHPNGYGFYDGVMFASILDNVGDREMYYHHQNDQAFRDWRSDADKACAAGDREICDKLKDLDEDMSNYRTKGIKVNPSYMTPGVDPDVYESKTIDRSKLASINVCTGAIGSDYSRFATTLAKVTKLKAVAISSNGSVDNLTKLAAGTCDMMFIQDDISESPNLTKIVTLDQPEAGILVCPVSSGIKTAKDVTDKTIIYIGSDQTGSQYTFDQIKHQTGLEKAKVDDTLATMSAVNRIKNTDGCLFAVTSPDSPAIKELDTFGKFQIVTIPTVDKYKTVNVDMSHYKTLTQADNIHKTGFLWLWKEGGTDTIGVKNSLVTSQTWIDQNKELFDLLNLERVNLESSLQ